MQDGPEAAQKSLWDYFTHCDHTCKTSRPQKKREDFETKAGDLGVIPLKMSN